MAQGRKVEGQDYKIVARCPRNGALRRITGASFSALQTLCDSHAAMTERQGYTVETVTPIEFKSIDLPAMNGQCDAKGKFRKERKQNNAHTTASTGSAADTPKS